MPPHATVWTIGHWSCVEQTFIELLQSERIELVADVRAHPGSRRNPQFDQDAMRGWLARADIAYLHLPTLGGHRHKQDVAPGLNAGWRQRSFHNYADYTLTPDYEHGIRRLIELAATHQVACLCAEPMPWRCHRLIIANTLAARGLTVRHIMNDRHTEVHQLGRWGATPQLHDDGTITYPGNGRSVASSVR